MKERFEQLQTRAQEAFAEGDLGLSAALFTRAEALALEHDDQDLADRAFCNRCAVLIELEDGQEQIPKLKSILLRSRDPKNRFLAAYYTAEAYRSDDDWERALSYAQRSTELAAELDEAPTRAASANLVGTIALRSCRFDEAEQAFATALESYVGADGYHRIMAAQVTDNLGYLRMCTGRLREGLELCECARLSLEELDARHYLYETLQDLCYGYTLDDQLDLAERCGEQALELAIENADELIAKNCLFLLAEIAVRQGDTFRARRFLRELAAHYPEVGISDEIVEVFLATDLTTVVNLRG
jgi:tetratricopeptide (TPR) repeat protein